MNKEITIRAIHSFDVLSDECPVYELNPDTHKFVMLSNKDYQIDDLTVYDNDDFILFEVKTSKQTTIDENDEEFIEIIKEIKQL